MIQSGRINFILKKTRVDPVQCECEGVGEGVGEGEGEGVGVGPVQCDGGIARSKSYEYFISLSEFMISITVFNIRYSNTVRVIRIVYYHT